MSDNGRHDPIVEIVLHARDGVVVPLTGDDDYDALLELDRLEELLEAMNELGAHTRADVEALPVSPTSVEVIAELNALGYTSTERIEARLAELVASLDDE